MRLGRSFRAVCYQRTTKEKKKEVTFIEPIENTYRNRVPEEDLLLLVRANAVKLVEEIEEGRSGLLQGGVDTRLEVAEVAEDSLWVFLL